MLVSCNLLFFMNLSMLKRTLLALLSSLIGHAALAYHLPHIPEQTVLRIGIKIWANECGNSIAGLTAWNKGEKFASLGIGHFLWYPSSKLKNKDQSFAVLIKYQEQMGITVPHWLQGNTVPPCPWRTREAFLRAQHSPRMRELRAHLAHTIANQSKFMMYRLDRSITHMLRATSNHDRRYIEQTLSALTAKPIGLYILVDYVNFKGLGLQSYLHHRNGWGLLPVIMNMRRAPRRLTTRQAFVWSADKLLTKRAYLSKNKIERQWLIGWRSRLKTYLS